jgi:hypothetical protein
VALELRTVKSPIGGVVIEHLRHPGEPAANPENRIPGGLECKVRIGGGP